MIMALPSAAEYEVDTRDRKLDLAGWGSTLPIFERLIKASDPRVIIEVGSFKGASAAHMAQLAPDAKLYCVDHWADWTNPDGSVTKGDLLFDQFLANMHLLGETVARRIIPVRAKSLKGHVQVRHDGYLRPWRAHGADLIYIDADHTYEGESKDILAYWLLLRRGGTLFGHDTGMPEVMRAVKDTAEQLGVQFYTENEHWILTRKP